MPWLRHGNQQPAMLRYASGDSFQPPSLRILVQLAVQDPCPHRGEVERFSRVPRHGIAPCLDDNRTGGRGRGGGGGGGGRAIAREALPRIHTKNQTSPQHGRIIHEDVENNGQANKKVSSSSEALMAPRHYSSHASCNTWRKTASSQIWKTLPFHRRCASPGQLCQHPRGTRRLTCMISFLMGVDDLKSYRAMLRSLQHGETSMKQTGDTLRMVVVRRT